MDGDRAATVTLSEKRAALCNLIRNDMHAADLRWSLFVAATQSYRHDSLLRPFPPQFVSEEGRSKDIDRLREVMTEMPAFPTLLSLLENPTCDCSNREVLIDLLYWVLVLQDDPVIKTLRKDEMNKVLLQAPGEKISKPDFIFSVHYKHEGDRQKLFRELSKKHKTFLSYHGSRLENFYSILQHGLVKTMSKSGMFGTGIYFSSDLNTTFLFSPSGCGWGGSLIGSTLSCQVLCEVVDHPDTVSPVPESEASKEADDSLCGPVPNKYLLVRNSDLVQIRYLLVYGKNAHPVLCQSSDDESLMGWFRKYKLLTLIVGYLLVLSAVGVSNNPTIMRYYRMFLRRWNH